MYELLLSLVSELENSVAKLKAFIEEKATEEKQTPPPAPAPAPAPSTPEATTEETATADAPVAPDQEGRDNAEPEEVAASARDNSAPEVDPETGLAIAPAPETGEVSQGEGQATSGQASSGESGSGTPLNDAA